MAVLDLTASAALFDMDGTLVDSTAIVETIWRDLCREHDVDASVLVPRSSAGWRRSWRRGSTGCPT